MSRPADRVIITDCFSRRSCAHLLSSTGFRAYKHGTITGTQFRGGGSVDDLSQRAHRALDSAVLSADLYRLTLSRSKTLNLVRRVGEV